MHLHSEKPKVAVVGVGYVGTVLASFLADVGISVVGIDKDQKIIDSLNQGHTSIYEEGMQALLESSHFTENFAGTVEFNAISNVDVVIVAVSTPLKEGCVADLSQITDVARKIGEFLSPGTLVCLKSTVVPGTTAAFSEILSRTSKLSEGKDFFLTYSPERLAEGSALQELNNLPIVVGADSPKSLKSGSQFWSSTLGLETVELDSFVAAELTKLADNLWIDMNIAIANLIGSISYKIGIDGDAVIRAANTLPKGGGNVNILNSSIGVGGSCLTKDPIFLANLLDRYDLDSSLIRAGRFLNDSMPELYVQQIQEWKSRNNISNLVVALVGLSFKSNTNDIRNSPMLKIYDLLNKSNKIKLYDPFLSEDEFAKEIQKPTRFDSLENCFRNTHVVILGCAHDVLKTSKIASLVPEMSKKRLIVDGRHGYKELADIVGNKNYISI